MKLIFHRSSLRRIFRYTLNVAISRSTWEWDFRLAADALQVLAKLPLPFTSMKMDQGKNIAVDSSADVLYESSRILKKGVEEETMPIYEFYCPDCHMIFNFFSKTIDTKKRPLCPKCQKIRLDRKMSVFARLRNRGDEEDTPIPDLDEAQMEKAMGALTKEMDHLDEEDPRQAANLMRKLTDMTGLELGPGMKEALHRMEAGEDPEKIEAEMGDVLEEEDPFLPKKGSTLSKSRPPRVDETLYDL